MVIDARPRSAKLLAEIDRTGRLLPHQGPGRHRVRVPELLPEQHFDIGLIIDHENEQVHARSPDLIRDAPVRGRTIRNSVNSRKQPEQPPSCGTQQYDRSYGDFCCWSDAQWRHES
jgi:hypothetical protein